MEDRNLKNLALNRKKKITVALKFIQDDNNMENERLSFGTKQNVMVTKLKSSPEALAATKTLWFKEDKPHSGSRKTRV